MLNNGPSEHLSWKELACKDGTPYPKEFILDGRVTQLAILFEDIRSLYNRLIIVLSAYRTSGWNRKIGGARYSQHVQGKALDLKPPIGVTVKQFYDDIELRASEFGIRGLGKYITFVHVDIRSGNKLIAWKGSGVKDSLTQVIYA